MLRVVRGDTWNLSWEWLDSEGVPVDLTGCTARIEFRRVITGAVLYSNTSVGMGDIQISPLDGLIELKVEPAVTETLQGTYLYDVEVTFPDDSVTTPIISKIEVVRDITREPINVD